MVALFSVSKGLQKAFCVFSVCKYIQKSSNKVVCPGKIGRKKKLRKKNAVVVDHVNLLLEKDIYLL